MLTAQGCLTRQQRLRRRLAAQDLDAALLTHPLEIYYFTGILLPTDFELPACLYLATKGSSWLVACTDEGAQCVDHCHTYPFQVGATMSPDPLAQMTQVAADRLSGEKGIKRLACQAESLPWHLARTATDQLAGVELVAIDDILADLQKRKDEDEVALIRRAIAADLAAYTAAQRVIAPGVNELEVLAAARQGACLAAGEKVFHDGDYQCGEMGGFARDRTIEAGELYVIDAWTTYRGYWADLCRTFSVDGNPTDLQQSIFDHIKAFHQQIPTYLQAGKDGSECFLAMDTHIRQHPALADEGIVHHAGHNAGLRAHQMPDLNRERGGTLEVGNIVSVEPGGYTAQARLGVRLENMYLITEHGPKNLSDYPMELIVGK
ncbi:MAG: M24 family metallopeptidase [Candidatus Latescibacteria bacterium]|nr:M24 family metallopeptidase [Candidatus Latescibacterota bacterium]